MFCSHIFKQNYTVWCIKVDFKALTMRYRAVYAGFIGA